MSTLFAKIVSGDIPADIVYQDESVTAFRDINPAAPTHILIVPNRVIPTVNDVTEADEQTLGHLFVIAARLAEEEGIAENGYRLIVNVNKHGRQEIFHLHMHLVGGQQLGAMVRVSKS